ncbi:MAG: hypothetical protein C4582_13490 [Desulfobacteraceae bacterium]|nr:MAG: hypothetical protein C4582_13490 [Desulfobacteraceae bacterium]
MEVLSKTQNALKVKISMIPGEVRMVASACLFLTSDLARYFKGTPIDLVRLLSQYMPSQAERRPW